MQDVYLFTCQTVKSSVSWFAAACIWRSTLHVPATRVSANSLKTDICTVKPAGIINRRPMGS